MKIRRFGSVLLLMYLAFTELIMYWTGIGEILFPFSIKVQLYLYAEGMLGMGNLIALILYLGIKILVLCAWFLSLIEKWHYQIFVGSILLIDVMLCIIWEMIYNDIPCFWLGVSFSFAVGALLIYDASAMMRMRKKTE